VRFLALSLSLLLGFSMSVKAASFDCAVTLNKTEKVICSNTVLNLLDEQLSKYYSMHSKELTKVEKSNLISKQREWLRERNNSCGSNVDCLVLIYASRIQELSFKPEKIEKTNVKFTHNPKRHSFKVEKKCDFSDVKFAPNLAVYAGGAYSGYKTNVQIDQSGHRTTKFDVAVNSPDAPVALILGAYEPSVWNIKWTQNTKIAAVYATGYHRQIVTGLPKNIPVITSSHGEKPNCGYLYIESKTLNKINPLSKRLFNTKVSLVTLAKKGKLGFGNAFTPKTQFFTNTDTTIKDYVDPSLPLAGKAGLDKLVKIGYLRKYNQQDVDRWVQLKSKQVNEDLPPVSGIDISSRYRPKYLHKGYVILKKITIPAGLYGGHSVTFFLDDNVPYPEGKLGHSTLYDFNTLKCQGTGCNH